MNNLPEINVSFEELNRIIMGPIRSKLLLTGIELKVFNRLSKPCSARDLAEVIDTHPENTRRFMDGLAACDLVLKKNGQYRNTPISQAFLVEGSDTYIGQMLAFSAKIYYPGLKDLPALVKKGPPQSSQEADSGFEELCANGAVVTGKMQLAGFAQVAVEVISKLPEFPSFRRMLDLGGGPGLIGIAIVSAHPSMKGVIFDLPAVVKVAETFIKEYEIEDRMEVLGGNYNNDPIGEEYDLIWASGTLNFSKNDMDSLIKRIYDVLNPGGVFVSFHDGLTGERTNPCEMVLGMLSSALMGQDMGLDQGFIADTMLRAGFQSVRSRTLETPMGPMDLDIGRK
ncbi:MAG: methyltransferase [Desulfobacterales bacterium S5133MH4]|nr:MAG: methyltransferase [Desulfobacterales bacterium S5133MH4]